MSGESQFRSAIIGFGCIVGVPSIFKNFKIFRFSLVDMGLKNSNEYFKFHVSGFVSEFFYLLKFYEVNFLH
jgi:hypothetical protein